MWRLDSKRIGCSFALWRQLCIRWTSGAWFQFWFCQKLLPQRKHQSGSCALENRFHAHPLFHHCWWVQWYKNHTISFEWFDGCASRFTPRRSHPFKQSFVCWSLRHRGNDPKRENCKKGRNSRCSRPRKKWMARVRRTTFPSRSSNHLDKICTQNIGL